MRQSGGLSLAGQGPGETFIPGNAGNANESPAGHPHFKKMPFEAIFAKGKNANESPAGYPHFKKMLFEAIFAKGKNANESPAGHPHFKKMLFEAIFAKGKNANESPVAVPGALVGDGEPSSPTDRGHSLRSLLPPPAALPSLPSGSPARIRMVRSCF